MPDYPLSFIIKDDYDYFIDYIINDCLNASVGECDYLIININMILECVEQKLENGTDESMISFNLHDAIDSLKEFIDSKSGESNILVFIQ